MRIDNYLYKIVLTQMVNLNYNIIMSIQKRAKDHIIKFMLGKDAVPRGLFESREYFRANGNIHFEYIKRGGVIIARSTDFRWGSIVTQGKNDKELDTNIKDAILTSFEIPSSYAHEANINRVGSIKEEYAIA